MAITWFRGRKRDPITTATPAAAPAPATVAAPATEIAQPRGRHARTPAPVDYGTGYDATGWGEAERELLMPARQRPPWEAGEGAFPAARGADRGRAPDLAELTLTDKPLGVLRPEAAPERSEPLLDLAGAPQDRPYVPQDDGLPLAWLRAVPHSGPGDKVLETLTGLPHHVGTRRGTALEGICLGSAGDIWLVLDTESDEVLDALEDAIRNARENRAPAARPDPQAAGHEDLEHARAVLLAAGNLGSLPAALKQADGAAVMDLLYARAALHHAVKAGDEAAAVKAASDLVDIVSELCDDETACALANGIAPAAEAAPGPEPAADAETAEDAAALAAEGAPADVPAVPATGGAL